MTSLPTKTPKKSLLLKPIDQIANIPSSDIVGDAPVKDVPLVSNNDSAKLDIEDLNKTPVEQ